MFAVLLLCSTAFAQFNIKDKIKDKATGRAEQRVDEALDKGIDKIEEGLKIRIRLKAYDHKVIDASAEKIIAGVAFPPHKSL